MDEERDVPISEIILDETIYPRNDVSGATVARLADAMLAGIEIPPVILDARSKRVADGFHRVHAARKLERDTIRAVLREYATEADLFADAVRLNANHGRPLDPYDVRRCVVRLTEYGLTREAIASIVHVAPVRIEEMERGFAATRGTNEPVPLKRGLSHFAGAKVTRAQVATVEKYGGMEGTYYARQIALLLKSRMWRPTAAFSAAMDEVVELWAGVQSGAQ